MSNSPTELLRSLPLHPDETWQGMLFQAPITVKGDKGKPYQPWMGVWLSATSGHAQPCMVDGEITRQRSPDILWEGLIQKAAHAEQDGYLPGTIEVCEADLADILRSRLATLSHTSSRRNTQPLTWVKFIALSRCVP